MSKGERDHRNTENELERDKVDRVTEEREIFRKRKREIDWQTHIRKSERKIKRCEDSRTVGLETTFNIILFLLNLIILQIKKLIPINLLIL